MLVTVKLYGHLRQFGREFEFDVDTVGEVIRALSANFTDFHTALVGQGNRYYKIIINNRLAYLDELLLTATEETVIKIVPVVVGNSDTKAILSIVAGVALMGVGLAIAGGLIGASLLGSYATMAASMIGGLGMSLTMGGVSSLLAGTTDISGNQAKQSNNSLFTNITDTIQQGACVPLGYGTMLCDIVPISVKVTVVEGEQ